MMNRIPMLLAALLAGCAVTTSDYGPSTGQPRALMLGVLMPNCVMFCTGTAISNESEGGGGNFAPSTNSANTVSPSMTIGMPGPKVPAPAPPN